MSINVEYVSKTELKCPIDKSKRAQHFIMINIIIFQFYDSCYTPPFAYHYKQTFLRISLISYSGWLWIIRGGHYDEVFCVSGVSGMNEGKTSGCRLFL